MSAPRAPLHDWSAYRGLDGLPALVEKQRELEGQLAALEDIAAQEKAKRDEINTLLVAAGFAKGTGVRCLGYDVVHHARDGQTSLNQETIIAELVAAGVDAGLVDTVITLATERGEPSSYASVKPAKGAVVKVPAPAAKRERQPKLRMATAALKPARRRG